MLVVILVREFKYGFSGLGAQPDNSTADQLVGPLAGAYQPGLANACQLLGGTKVNHGHRVLVQLQERCRHVIVHFSLYDLFQDRSFVFAPGKQHHLFRVLYGGHALF